MEQVGRTVDAIFEFLEMDPLRADTWYDPLIRNRSGIDKMGRIPFYHHQTLWDNRQNELIYQIYRELFSDDDLLVSVDRVNLNPPVTDNWVYEGFVHWDFEVAKRPSVFKPQGLLCLSDDNGDAGGFQCVPGFHLIIDDWLSRQPPDYNSRFPDVTGMEIKNINLRAGDFVIFHGALPHGNRPNRSKKPRLAQYFTMFPERDISARERRDRIEAYRCGLPTTSITGKPFPVMKEKSQDTSEIKLSEIGRKLLGI